MTVLDLITEALAEMGAYAQGETPTAADANAVLNKLNRLLDAWNASDVLIYDESFVNYVLTPLLAPHTIGPTGTFVVATRPTKILNASIILNTTTPNVNNPLMLRDSDWWANQRVQDLQSTLPTDLYYSPAFPDGELNLWPIPQIAYGLQLETSTLLTQVTLLTTFTLPPGYRDAITLTLAESICPMFGKALSPDLKDQARVARGKVILPNTQSAPRISTMDSGMASSSQNRSSFNYLTGTNIKQP